MNTFVWLGDTTELTADWTLEVHWLPITRHDLRRQSRGGNVHGQTSGVTECALYEDTEDTPTHLFLGPSWSFKKHLGGNKTDCSSHRTAGSRPGKRDVDLFENPVFVPGWGLGEETTCPGPTPTPRWGQHRADTCSELRASAVEFTEHKSMKCKLKTTASITPSKVLLHSELFSIKMHGQLHPRFFSPHPPGQLAPCI